MRLLRNVTMACYAGLLLSAGVLATPASAEPTGGAVLQYSTSSIYSSPRTLNGASVSGRVAIFVTSGAARINSVTFSLNGRTVRTERFRPYDLSGDSGGRSHMLDTSKLTAGRHTVSAVVATPTGSTTLTAGFTTGNAATASWPSASHVGPTGALAASGSIRATTDGMVIENKVINGSLIIDADNVTIRNVRIEWDGRLYPVIVESDATGAKLDRVEIDGNVTSGSSVRQDAAAIIGGNYTLTNFHIHHVPEGPRLGSNVTLRVGLIEALVPIGTNHVDAIQIIGPTTNTRVQQVAIKAFTPSGSNVGINAALQAGTERGDVNGVTFAANYFDGGAVPVNLGGGGTRDAAIRFENNLFGRGARGDVIKYTSPAQVFINNVFADNGAPVPLD